jgi:tetratricopeptide (TPR) repeat protein
MTEEPVNQEKRFVSSTLPWIIAAGALLVYLLTLNHSVALNNLPQVARLSGWIWQPDLYDPVFWLVTYPIRLLPAKLIPLALNLFAALCAAATLGLLARSVSLLPHDRTREQRERERDPSGILSIPQAWVPPVLAAIVCGFQLTFWESATSLTSSQPYSASSQMLDVLLFAYVIRCLLEFRISEQDHWLLQASFVCGLGMTNDWGMVGFFPLFLVAMVWIKGMAFFNGRFLLRAFLCGVAGLSLYLLLPLVQSLAGDSSQMGFWAALKFNLGAQKHILSQLLHDRHRILVLSLTSILPVFVIGIRWASHFGDTNPVGLALARFMFRVVHALFLVACIWVAMDPPASPRYQGNGIGFLSFYFLGALAVGYLSGYFLLLGNVRPGSRLDRAQSGIDRLLNKASVAGVWILLVIAPLALVYKNLPEIRTTNSKLHREFAANMMGQFPEGQKAVVLSDDLRCLFLLQAALARSGKEKNYLLIDTASLKWPAYQRRLSKTYSGQWPVAIPKSTEPPVSDFDLAQMVLKFAESKPVYYLHPSFGYYFEAFWPQPHGLIYRMNPYATNILLATPPSPALVTENEQFWKAVKQDYLPRLTAAASDKPPAGEPAVITKLMSKLHIERRPNKEAKALAVVHARALNHWGVEMQKLGRLDEAAAHFQAAIDLNDDNVAARLNLEYNTNLRAGRRSSVQVSKTVEDEFGKYRSWDQMIGDNGPFDEPNFCFEQGRTFARGSNYRQAIAQFIRARELAPDSVPAALWLAQLYVVLRVPDQALDVVRDIKSRPGAAEALRTNTSDLMYLEAAAHLTAGDAQAAFDSVRKVVDQPGGAEDLFASAIQVFLQYGNFTNALRMANHILKAAPDSIMVLINKGYTCIQLGSYAEALPPLNRALELCRDNLEFRNQALFNRAVAYLRSDDLDAAQKDYEVLYQHFTNAFPVLYGLHEVGFRKKDTNLAVKFGELYLSNAPPSQELDTVRDRLKGLKPKPR